MKDKGTDEEDTDEEIRWRDHRWRVTDEEITDKDWMKDSQKSWFQDIWHLTIKVKIKKNTHFTIRTNFLFVILYIFVVMYIKYAIWDIKISKF
jgi:hypothetical protein